MSFTVNQLATATSTGTSFTITFTSAVAAGDFLYIILASADYFSSSKTFTSVSDNVNGAWTILDNTGVLTSGNVYVTGAFAYFANTAAAGANGLTITVNGAGSTGANIEGVAVDLVGAATSSPIVGHLASSYAPTADAFTTPSVSDTNSGDFVIGWVVGFTAAGGFTAGTGATLDSSYEGSGGSTIVGALHLTSGSLAGSNSVSGAESVNDLNAVGTVIIASAGGGGGGGSNSATVAWLS
jgi:hypothetical protein